MHTHEHTQADSECMLEGSWEAARLFTAVGKVAKSRAVIAYVEDNTLELHAKKT